MLSFLISLLLSLTFMTALPDALYADRYSPPDESRPAAGESEAEKSARKEREEAARRERLRRAAEARRKAAAEAAKKAAAEKAAAEEKAKRAAEDARRAARGYDLPHSVHQPQSRGKRAFPKRCDSPARFPGRTP